MTKTEKLESQISELEHLVNGIEVAIERIREIRERIYLSKHTPDFHEGVSFVTDAVLKILRSDKAEMEQARLVLRKELVDGYGPTIKGD